MPQLLGLSIAGLFGLLPFMRVEPWLVFNTPCYTAQDWDRALQWVTGGTRGFKFHLARFTFKHVFYRRSVLQHLQRRGVPEICFVHNHTSSWDNVLRRIQPDGLRTDYPKKYAAWLAQSSISSSSSSGGDSSGDAADSKKHA
jgi:hypothetical protein